MRKADFLNAVKQKAIPNFGSSPTQPAVPQLPSATGQGMNGVPPKSGVVSPATRLLLPGIAPTGGTLAVEDISTDYWFSALQPIAPVAPASYRPRQRAFLPGENIIWTPGDDKGGVTFEALRTLADSWDLLRLVIETRKDQLSRLKWNIRAKKIPGEKAKDRLDRETKDPQIQKLTSFFDRPDGFHSWNSWLRMWVEDSLVLDAAPLYYQRDLLGRIAGVMPLDGATVNRLLTDQGITPQYPSAAYQQVVYGTPACDFTTKDLLYVMKNERTHRRYGYSAVEQCLITISIGLRRQDFQLKYYTDGNMPEGLCFIPPNIPVSKIKEIQDWFDSVLSGNSAKRRRMTFLPGYGTSASSSVTPNVVFPKEVLLHDDMDDWLMRIVCFAFSVSPQNLMKQMNRASAQQSSVVAQEEGLEPTLVLVHDVCNTIIAEMGLGDKYEFNWAEEREVDPLKQAQIDNLLLGKVYSVNETRERRGDDLRDEPEADELGIFGPNGFVPLGTPVSPFQVGAPALTEKPNDNNPPNPPAKKPTDKKPVVDKETKKALTEIVGKNLRKINFYRAASPDQ